MNHHPIAIVISIKAIVQSGQMGVKLAVTGSSGTDKSTGFSRDSKISTRNANGFTTGTAGAYIWYDTDFVWYDGNVDWTISFIFRCIIGQFGGRGSRRSIFRVRNYRKF